MPGVRIVTDSACDLSEEQVAALGIEVVPLKIRFGDEELVDREELSTEDFYARLRTAEQLPETAAPAPGAFEERFRAAAEAGCDGVVCINLSSDLSATMQAATTAASNVGDAIPVRVLDSKSITAGLGTMVTLAAEAARDGATVEEIEQLVEQLVRRTRVYGTLDTLEYLKKGGRIGGAQALLGTMLSIKPCVNLSNGIVEEAGRQRTRRRAFQWLRDLVAERGAVEHLSVMHADAPDVGDLVELLAANHPRESIDVGLIGAVIGTHGGPGTIGVCWLDPQAS